MMNESIIIQILIIYLLSDCIHFQPHKLIIAVVVDRAHPLFGSALLTWLSALVIFIEQKVKKQK